MGRFTVNRKLFWVKAHYFLYFGGAASFWSFVTVFGKQLGVSEIGVGLIFTVAPITGIISMPLFGSIADRFNIKKKLFILFNLLNAVSFLSFALLPNVTTSKPIAVECRENETYLTQCAQKYDTCNAALIHSFVNDINNLSTPNTILKTECYINCEVSRSEKSTLCENSVDMYKNIFCQNPDDASVEFSTGVMISAASFTQDCISFPVDFLSYNSTSATSQHSHSCQFTFSNKSCVINCPNNQNLNRHLERISSHSDFFKTSIFWIYSGLVLAGWICMAVVTSVADCLCFETLGETPHLYGKQRQWGAIGWGSFSMLAGYLIDVKSKDNIGILKDYSPAFYLMAVLFLLNLIVCYMWDVKKTEKTKTLGKDMMGLIRNPTILVFVLSCIAVGMCTGLLWQFLFWYVEDLAAAFDLSCEFSNLRYIKSLQGLISIVQCFGGELPFFYISGWFIKRLGHVHCVTLVLTAFAFRFFFYSILQNPWTVLPVELFQGLTYGIFYANMASYAYVVSPPGSAATVQGIVGAAFEGVGVGAGSLLGGVLYSVISGRTAFRVFACGTLMAAILHGSVMYFINKRNTVSLPKDYSADVPTKHFELDKMLSQDQITEN